MYDCLVPIVPYWNWNKDNEELRDLLNYVPIVPYWNWNWIPALFASGEFGSNRTLLELKYWWCLDVWRRPEFQSYLTGIEIWQHRANPRYQLRSNRTLLELKYARINQQQLLIFSSNRTLLELKYPQRRGNNRQYPRSNRTLLELKYVRLRKMS